MEDYMSIKSKFMTGVVSKILNVVLHKKLGYKIDTRLNEVFISNVDDELIRVHLNIDADMTKSELMRFLNELGLN